MLSSGGGGATSAGKRSCGEPGGEEGRSVRGVLIEVEEGGRQVDRS